MTDAHVTGVRMVAIPVADHDRAIEFYSVALGLTKSADRVIEELGSRWVQMSAPGIEIALLTEYPGFSAGRDTGVRLVTADARALHAHLVGHGAKVNELLLWEGLPPMFEFDDIDGNTLYAVQ
ncbi:hypothetical protein CH304_09595 [Rhodococcus sp. 15-649-1-2]|nr:VOC family protein [Rhodococcus sp. 15-649-1-2]OZE83418.1 hypothetical protein CH304_09595 [Rhodococcus sp. 15-649-1-2]